MDYNIVSNLLSECVAVYNHYVTNNGFNAPLPAENTSYYAIYLVPNSFMSSLGLTRSDNSGKSKIYIRYSQAVSSDADYKVTLVHEFNHAVMSAYQCVNADLWFKESFSSMMALVYYGSSTYWYNFYVPKYLTRSYCSITDNPCEGFAYGALMYPLYIYNNLGGLVTIRTIYEEYEEAGNAFDAITNSVYIYSYSSAFMASVTRNYKPTYYFTYANSSWGTGVINDNSISSANTINDAVNPMACHYQRFSSSNNIGTVYFTVEITSNDGSGMMLSKITETSNGALENSTVSPSFTRITIQQDDFGANIKKITLIPVNTNRNGASIGYRLTISF